MGLAECKDRNKLWQQILNPLLEAKSIEITIPDKPSSRKQQYRLPPAASF